MQIVELSDYSMVIMKDSQDTPWDNPGVHYRIAKEHKWNIVVLKYDDDGITFQCKQTSSDAIYTAGRLILLFSEPLDSRFTLHSRVHLA